MSAKATPESFWARVDKSGECWEWTGATNNTGYGTLTYQGQSAVAHRVAAYILGVVDTIAAPTDRSGSGFILHQCDNPVCCRPEHWKVGTYAQNQREAYARKRRAQPKGSNHANSRLSPEQVGEIRAAWPATRQRDLAEKYGVSQVCISLIVRGATYVPTTT